MTHPVDTPSVPETPISGKLPDVSGAVASAEAVKRSAMDAAASSSRTAADQLGRARSWGGERPMISVAAAGFLALGASVLTAIYVRRRTQAQDRRLAWLAARRSSLGAALPSAQRVAPFGGAGGALLMTVMMLARMRRAQAQHSRMDELTSRLAELEARAGAHLPSDRPHPRDVVIGVGVGLALAGLISRVRPAK